ncbi:MAG TPA: sensor domain-containing diguanylate cyclase [Nitrospirae bacterium]|nr:response regulator PleD [bacterium BMS3Abin09]GBE40979.1 response regulator PleD [bacterium BMS3Bbin09]HDH34769.1 sensor domain-containing diguanylate cyclase [Nitrospirota bacterium]HDO67173.1 sensor domain-containing diguanylate cyclase [Nitrospirota bacterium]HDZ84100.1 sensor domain-containing diguanylate cyclase [Nitrospirota bacterium]
MSISKILKRILNFLTFTDIPIWQKLLLFAIGGIVWFIIIAVIGLGAVTYVNDSSKALTNEVVPQILASQKVIIKIRGANVSVYNIAMHDDINIVNNHVQRANILFNDVSVILNALLKGGLVKDYSDLTGDLIEEFQVLPVKEGSRSERYVKETLAKNQNIRKILNELVLIKKARLKEGGGTAKNKALFMNKLKEYDALTVQAVTILGKLTSWISVLQKSHTIRIQRVLKQSMAMFIFVGILAVILLTVFSYLLKISITRPLKAITEQIKILSEGEVDLTKQITIGSQDEIADLSANFNMLMQTIYDMNTFKKVIEEDDDLTDVYVRLAKVFNEGLGLDDISIYEATNRNKSMQILTTPYTKDDIYCNREIFIDNSLCRARKTGRRVSSIEYSEICKQFLFASDKYHVCVPMIVGASIGGVVQFRFDKTIDKQKQEEITILDNTCIERLVLKAEQYIAESSAVIEAKRLTSALKESSVRDPMTGLYNRRFLEEYVETLIARVARKEGVIGLLMCDLDFFKQVNDKFGHDAGDIVLIETAKVIAANARAADLTIRFGGEEFLVIVSDAKEGEAGVVAERIRKMIEELKVKTSGGIIQKTISVGYSEFPKDTHNFWEAIKYADIALYKAKESGRNRCIRFEKEMWNKEAY